MGRYLSWVELCPQKKYAEVLALVPMSVILLGKRIFVHVIKVRWGHTGLKWTIVQWLMSLKEEKKETQRHAQEEGHVKTGSVEAIWPWTEEHQVLPATARIWKEARKDPLLAPSERVCSCWHLDFRCLVFRTVRE